VIQDEVEHILAVLDGVGVDGVGELLAEALVGGLSVLLPDQGRRHIIWIIFGIFITPTALGVL
jgi:hypothetical protein